MSKSRVFQIIIDVDEKADGRVWLVEDRAFHPDGSRSRPPRVRVGISTSDLAGLTNQQVLWRLAHALTASLKTDPAFDLF